MSEAMIGKIGLCTEYCKGCCWRSAQYNSCDYILFEGNHSRGCPVGDGCDKRLLGRRAVTAVPTEPQISSAALYRAARRKAESDARAQTEASRTDSRTSGMLERRTEMWKQGLTDKQIAEAEGCEVHTVTHWRNRHGLAVNRQRSPKRVYRQNADTSQRMARRMELYRQGLSDRQIAETEGSARRLTIAAWRQSHGLPANTGNKSPDGQLAPATTASVGDERLMELYRQGYSDRGICAALGMLSGTAIYNWRRKHGLPPNTGHGSKSIARARQDDAQRMELYRQGLSDGEIAKALGHDASSTIYKWRKKNGLPANCKGGRKKRVPK